MDELNIQLADTQKKYDIAKAELDKFSTKADISENAEYKATNEKISALEKEIEEMSAESTGKTELEAKKAVLKDEIAEIAGKIVAADNSKVKERIAELEAEQKEVGQKIAEQEQMIDLVEDFIRAKMNMISEKINEMFKIVSFKLFDVQINGGLKETCTCTVPELLLSGRSLYFRFCLLVRIRLELFRIRQTGLISSNLFHITFFLLLSFLYPPYKCNKSIILNRNKYLFMLFGFS